MGSITEGIGGLRRSLVEVELIHCAGLDSNWSLF